MPLQNTDKFLYVTCNGKHVLCVTGEEQWRKIKDVPSWMQVHKYFTKFCCKVYYLYMYYCYWSVHWMFCSMCMEDFVCNVRLYPLAQSFMHHIHCSSLCPINELEVWKKGNSCDTENKVKIFWSWLRSATDLKWTGSLLHICCGAGEKFNQCTITKWSVFCSRGHSVKPVRFFFYITDQCVSDLQMLFWFVSVVPIWKTDFSFDFMWSLFTI